jgi:hypothetical protein
MTKLELIFFDAGGGHRRAATALCQVIEREGYPWQAEMVNLQELLEPIDIIRRLSGLRLQDVYNVMLKKDWTLGTPQLLRVLQAAIHHHHHEAVRLLARHWELSRPDLVVSLIPHFNRALREALSRASPGAPFVTVLTDLADYPPHFWIEPQPQFFVCGSEKAVEQAREMGIPEDLIYRASGMVISPEFYDPVELDIRAERRRLGLDPVFPTGLVMFGGQGSKAMLEIARELDNSTHHLQLIFVCGRNEEVARELHRRPTPHPSLVVGYTRDMPTLMHLSDFFIGKPGPGSISEALAMKLPVIVQKNAWTLPQERYNADWVREKQVGLVTSSFREIPAAVDELLQPRNFARFRSNTAALNNRAVFEVPSFLQDILARTEVHEAAPAFSLGH